MPVGQYKRTLRWNHIKQPDGHLSYVETIDPDDKNRTMIMVQCECGRFSDILATQFKSGLRKTCGHDDCPILKSYLSTRLTHGGAVHGKTDKVYRAWSHIKDRCLNPDSHLWEWYGARGITLHEPWINDFAGFRDHMGPCPGPGYTVDRIDNDKGYEPGNLRWATMKEQGRNRRRNRSIGYEGEHLTVAAIAERAGVNENALWRQMFQNNRTVYDAIALIKSRASTPGFATR